jgi:hypothetical protein
VNGCIRFFCMRPRLQLQQNHAERYTKPSERKMS